MPLRPDQLLSSALSAQDPIRDRRVWQKLEKFFGKLEADQIHRAENMIAIYTAAQSLFAWIAEQDNLPPIDRRNSRDTKVALWLRDQSGQLITKEATLRLFFSTTFQSFSLSLWLPSTNWQRNDTDDPVESDGHISVSSLLPFPKGKPDIAVGVKSIYTGLGWGTGLCLCVNQLAQAFVNHYCSDYQRVPVVLTDMAEADGAVDTNGQPKKRKNWTTRLVTTMDDGWHASLLDRLLRLEPSFWKYYYPQPRKKS
jgi:hypothetical protein